MSHDLNDTVEVIPTRRMHRHPRGLVYAYHPIVFVDDSDGLICHGGLVPVQLVGDDVSVLDDSVESGFGFTVDGDLAGGDGFFLEISGGVPVSFVCMLMPSRAQSVKRRGGGSKGRILCSGQLT